MKNEKISKKFVVTCLVIIGMLLVSLAVVLSLTLGVV